MCAQGLHRLVDGNVYWQRDKRSDRPPYPLCRTCRNDSAARSRQHKRDNRTEQTARTCPSGHLIHGQNDVAIQTQSGRTYHYCRACRAAKDLPERNELTNGEFATVEVWKQLPKDMRGRVAGVLLDDRPPDPLVSAVIRRAALTRVWVRYGVDAAAVAFVEALIAQSRESNSPSLRIDRLLALVVP
jgi:hypothetical protein